MTGMDHGLLSQVYLLVISVTNRSTHEMDICGLTAPEFACLYMYSGRGICVNSKGTRKNN